MAFDLGDKPIKLPIEVRDDGGNLADPVDVILHTRSPVGVDAEQKLSEEESTVQKEKTGVYVAAFTATEAGVWEYWWTTEGGIVLETPRQVLRIRESSEEGMHIPSAREIRSWSQVPFDELGYGNPDGSDSDPLDIVIERSVAEFQNDLGIKLTDVEKGSDEELLIGEAIQMYTEWRVGSSQPELLESVYDFDVIQSFSASNYSETRRGYSLSSQIKHPWPRLNRLLSLISGDMAGDEVPTVSGIGSDGHGADWERQRYIMDACRRQMPGFVYSPPWDGGVSFP